MLLLAVICILFNPLSELPGQDAKPPTKSEADYYPIVRYDIPPDIVLEAGAIEPLPDGSLAVATRRGDIYRVHNFDSTDPAALTFEQFAQGLHEVLGMTWHDGWLYVTQRCDVTRLRDTDNDGMADDFEIFCDGWSITGDYHEYAFGSPFDRDGNMWVTLCLTGSFNSDVPWRGWAVRIDKDGNMIPTCSGIRSPGGIALNALGDVFYTDNQGPWNGTCSLKWLRPGSFQGHPGGNRWFELTEGGQSSAPAEPVSNSRIMTEADRIPELEPPAVLFPYQKMGQSASGIACDTSNGQFGPFSDQFFVGDVTHSTVMRCSLEQVEGHYQGACFPFREGMGSGSLALRMLEDGSLAVGGTNRGWGSRGTKPFALERLYWSGQTPFEILSIHAEPDGFTLRFTEPVSAATAIDPTSWALETWCYIYQSSYGSPEVERTHPNITSITVGPNLQSVRLVIEGLQRGHIHEVRAAGLRSADDLPLLHDVAYYTLNYIPTR
jgi:glucose/arabinose dehydrogenase